MRATEILGSVVVDANGVAIAPVRDIRLIERDGRFRVAALVIGNGFLAQAAHRTGFAAGRVARPWLFRLLFRSAITNARFVSPANVVSWERDAIRIDVEGDDLPRLVALDTQ